MKLKSADFKKLINDYVNDSSNFRYFDRQDSHANASIKKPWKRECKTRVRSSDFIGPEDLEYRVAKEEFEPIDGIGFLDVQGLKNVNLKDCWHRVFVEPEHDNFRCECISDPKDEKILVFEFIVD